MQCSATSAKIVCGLQKQRGRNLLSSKRVYFRKIIWCAILSLVPLVFPAPKDLAVRLQLIALTRLTDLDMSGSAVTEGDLMGISALEELQSLNLANCTAALTTGYAMPTCPHCTSHRPVVLTYLLAPHLLPTCCYCCLSPVTLSSAAASSADFKASGPVAVIVPLYALFGLQI